MRNTILTITAASPMAAASKKVSASAAALFAVAFLMMTAPAIHADEYCITNGAQVAHGCGYASMEQCRAASAGFATAAPLIAEAPFAKKNQAGESNRARSNGPTDIVISWAASTPRRVHPIDR
jgi:Protein of unknown function (DUF3551)